MSKKPGKKSSSASTLKPWGGRFSEPTDAFVERFTASVNFDRRLYKQDIRGSLAHAEMLCAQGILSKDDDRAIHQGLHAIEQDIEQGKFKWSVALEDVHMNIETELTRRIGIAGKRLHTGRSRNDQVATDIRLYLRNEIDTIRQEIAEAKTPEEKKSAGNGCKTGVTAFLDAHKKSGATCPNKAH